jgi:DNA-binding beta-propeller fold protein YncE
MAIVVKIRFIAWLWLPMLLAGCGGDAALPDVVFGRHGVVGGEFVKPRAIAIDPNDRLYVVDWTARIQVFDRQGKFLGISFSTPDYRNGRPSGLGIGKDGNLLVCDSHYNCLRIYSPDGKLLRTIGGELGIEPGQLSYVSDVVQDQEGFFYLAEFGSNQRISKFDESGKFVACWGSPGSEPEQFARIRALALGPDGLLYAADACNHRIQVYTLAGKLVRLWGTPGNGLGELSYPYDLAFAPGPEPILYVVEYGNHRVQKFTGDGNSLGVWGGPGRTPGKLASPWALAVDSRGDIHVVDSENDRVQRIGADRFVPRP